jgi:DNA-binding transcriptional LysR family regulator
LDQSDESIHEILFGLTRVRFNKLDLNLLVALDAMLELQSISRAAERLHMSQSSMSNALARLREYFEDDLLVQVGRKMELTARAATLRDAVRDVLLRVDTTITAQPRFDPAQSDREFRISVSDYTMVTLMPHLLALASAQSKTVRFQLLPQVGQPELALERGESDLLVVPKAYCSPDHPLETLFEEHFCCAVWRGSRLATSELSFDVYAAAGHVVMQPPGDARPAFESWFMQRFGLARRIDVTTFSFASAPALVVGTDRVATVHRRLARQLAQSLPIVLLPLPVPMQPMEQAMQWHKYRSTDPGLSWLRGLLLAAVDRMDAGEPRSTSTANPLPAQRNASAPDLRVSTTDGNGADQSTGS